MNHGHTKNRWTIRVARLILCATSVNAGQGQAHGELPNEIRVVTYNINHGQGMDGKLDLPRLAEVIVAQKPDLVALQAVDEKTERSSGIDQAAELGRLTGMKAVFSSAREIDGGRSGNAVLTRFPVRSQETVKLKRFTEKMPERAEPRVVQVVELGEKEGPGLFFLCTSLDYRPFADERMDSAKTINELIKKHGDSPAILAGTLNMYPGFEVPPEFSKMWKIAGVDETGKKFQTESYGNKKRYLPTPSYPADEPRYYSNYVMYRPMRKWQVIELRVLDEDLASNHRPVLAVLRRAEGTTEVGIKK